MELVPALFSRVVVLTTAFGVSTLPALASAGKNLWPDHRRPHHHKRHKFPIVGSSPPAGTTYASLPFNVTLGSGDYLWNSNYTRYVLGPATTTMNAGDEVSTVTNTTVVNFNDGHTATLNNDSTVMAMAADSTPPAAIADPYITVTPNSSVTIAGSGHRIKIKTSGATLGVYGCGFVIGDTGGVTTATVNSSDTTPLQPTMYWLGNPVNDNAPVPAGYTGTMSDGTGRVTVHPATATGTLLLLTSPRRRAKHGK